MARGGSWGYLVQREGRGRGCVEVSRGPGLCGVATRVRENEQCIALISLLGVGASHESVAKWQHEQHSHNHQHYNLSRRAPAASSMKHEM